MVRLRVMVAALAIALAGWVLFDLHPNIGDLEECGTGNYFLAPLSYFWALITTTVGVSIGAAVAILILLKARAHAALLVLVAVEVGAATVGTWVSETQHACARITDHSYVQATFLIVLFLSGVIVGIAFAATAGRRSAVQGPQPPAASRMVGGFEVLESEVPRLPVGTLVWIAIDDTDLLGLDAAGTVGLRLPRDHLTADAVSWASALYLDGRPILQLRPVDGRPESVAIALERRVG
jgi:hypothetical protein